METYTINFVNNSGISGSFCVYQQTPYSQNPDVFPLAWLAQFSDPNTKPKVSIGWNTQLYFVWAKTGKLKPGIIFNAGEALMTGIYENNAVTLTKSNGNYLFINQTNGNSRDRLEITPDQYTAVNQASVGIGMSGSGTFAVQTQPRKTFSFDTRAEYWITFGDLKQGQVLDPPFIINPERIEFPHGIYSMNVTYNWDYTWTIEQGDD
jgi:hypothetical protein